MGSWSEIEQSTFASVLDFETSEGTVVPGVLPAACHAGSCVAGRGSCCRRREVGMGQDEARAMGQDEARAAQTKSCAQGVWTQRRRAEGWTDIEPD
eukprot:2780206-Rhodomonas_salina.1